ncbi:DUF2334 domain-containing protein [Bacillus sp. 31A1R]|uniref:DUF2334 domain-containing protein n=1 Tax=Robertmurraya mangrovi TaxID=3098077 RepID=A0ABU5J2L9_9BACI|nr:DUF2334 domain-containing protein [Bacillus sp. 31A1R]MDZ5473667.1 DUF2334 domain-containing protein [Bacillus sp. 31A1R]
MKKRLWKRLGLIVSTAIIGAVVYILQLTYIGENTFPNLNKHHAIIRLEDVGPGGDYASQEDLGKLRAVVRYIESERIPFHITVIPRMKKLESDGTWQERGIDDPSPDPLVTAFINILKEAAQKGGVLGMHGYTHQYGDTVREDESHHSGIGNEFHVKGVPETKKTSYAAERISLSLAAFEKNGLQPAFWESPHYRNTREQEKVFRSYIGILYQPDMYSLRSLKDMNVYDTINTYGQNSLGSIYVPAPFKYVTDSKSVNQILSKAEKEDGLASLYYHPFLEFPFLEPVLEPDGKMQVKDGLPVYKYKEDGTKSYLHQLVHGFLEEGYRWMSIHDIVPFTPAHRIKVPTSVTQQLLIGDVFGKGHEDVVVREEHRILVIPGTYKWPRNRPQNEAEIWLKESFVDEEQLLLADLNQDGKADLVAYNKNSGDLRVSWANTSHFMEPVLLGKLPVNLSSLNPFQYEGGTGLLAQNKERIQVIRIVNNQLSINVDTYLPEESTLYIGRFQDKGFDGILCVSAKNRSFSILHYKGDGKFTNPHLIKGIDVTPKEQLLVGDPNGDGKSDLILYTPKTGVWQVYENEGNQQFKLIENDFGPWAGGKGRVGVVADFDGNGKTDIGSYDETRYVLDIALSFREDRPSRGK